MLKTQAGASLAGPTAWEGNSIFVVFALHPNYQAQREKNGAGIGRELQALIDVGQSHSSFTWVVVPGEQSKHLAS